ERDHAVPPAGQSARQQPVRDLERQRARRRLRTGHGAGVGDTVVLSGASAVAGLTLSGSYVIAAVGDRTGANPLDKYLINAGSNANATTTGGGAAVTAKYEITVGTELGGQGNGFGIGQFGMGNFGDPRIGQGIYIEPRVWSLDH